MRAILKDRNVALATTVAALGYFVDIFELLLFALVRVKSLKDILGAKIVAAQDDLAMRAKFASPEALQQAKDLLADRMLRDAGVMLDNILQMTGLVLGGIVWGVLADRLGRLQMLFGSILVYSVANILNAFVADVPAGESPWAAIFRRMAGMPWFSLKRTGSPLMWFRPRSYGSALNRFLRRLTGFAG